MEKKCVLIPELTDTNSNWFAKLIVIEKSAIRYSKEDGRPYQKLVFADAMVRNIKSSKLSFIRHKHLYIQSLITYLQFLNAEKHHPSNYFRKRHSRYRANSSALFHLLHRQCLDHKNKHPILSCIFTISDDNL